MSDVNVLPGFIPGKSIPKPDFIGTLRNSDQKRQRKQFWIARRLLHLFKTNVHSSLSVPEQQHDNLFMFYSVGYLKTKRKNLNQIQFWVLLN